MATMRIALTNLGKYNEGILDFVWLDLPATEEEIAEAFDKIEVSHDDAHYYSDLHDNDFRIEYEEYFITDYECSFYKIGEYEDLDDLNEIAETLEGLDSHEESIVTALMEEGYDLEEALENKDDVIVYSGCHDMTDVAYEYVEETGMFHGCPDCVTNYFDYESFGNDLRYDGQWFEVDGDMAVLY